MQSCYNPTRRNMEDDLNIFENGRRPQFLRNGRRPKFLGNGRRPQFLRNGRRPQFLELEDDLNLWKMEVDLNFWKMEDNPKQLKVKAMVVAPLRVTLYIDNPVMICVGFKTNYIFCLFWKN